MKQVSKKQARYLRALISGQNNTTKAQVPKGAGTIVVNSDGQILLGKRTDTNEMSTPGGKVDGKESFKTAAIRELQEETGLLAKTATKLHASETRHNGKTWQTETFVVKSYTGKLASNGELDNLKFYHIADLPWKEMPDYTREPLVVYINSKLKKSQDINFLLAEELSKNIVRSGNAPSDTVYESTHGDAMRLVGTGTFRMLRNITKDMNDEDFKKINLDSYVFSIRKHVSDVYSGRIEDGHKTIHQFTNKSLPSVCAELMSVFEWYSPEDEPELTNFAESSLSDTDVAGGVNNLLDNYSKHNLSNIYTEMENIRKEIRVGTTTDVAQVEKRMMRLFDKLESTLTEGDNKHNELAIEAGNALDEMEAKLRALQTQIESLQPAQPRVVNGYASEHIDHAGVHNNYYPYLPKPTVTIQPDGTVKISFAQEWPVLEQQNFLTDLKVKLVKKKKK